MIELTRLNNAVLAVNSDLIKFVEESPDTVITLTTGEKLIVKESYREVNRKMAEARQSLRSAVAAISGSRPPGGDFEVNAGGYHG